MEETILQNELVREALDWFCQHLEKTEKLEFSKAMRSITEESFEKHDAVAVMCRKKRIEVEKLLRQ